MTSPDDCIFPQCFHTGVVETTERGKLLSDALAGWGGIFLGAAPRRKFSEAMQAIGNALGIAPTSENIMAESRKWLAERRKGASDELQSTQ